MHIILDSNSRAAPSFEALTDSEVLEGYNRAMDAYEAAKAGVGCRVETFTNLLVAERILANHDITTAATSQRIARHAGSCFKVLATPGRVCPQRRDAMDASTRHG
jgi:hypothetical protein